jgi:hypothetical protein
VQELLTPPKVVIVNLCMSLIAAEVLFLAGIDQTSLNPGCGIIAVFLQYTLLCAFMVRATLSLFSAVENNFIFSGCCVKRSCFTRCLSAFLVAPRSDGPALLSLAME